MASATTARPRTSPDSHTYVANPPSARRTMEALREMGYNSYDSILDLIDNSIDAEANSVDIALAERDGDIVIRIHDDGSGMDGETMAEAIRLGSETERIEGDLGKFGMGLVTASIGLSRSVEVWTKEADEPASRGGFDLDEIYDKNEFLKWIETPSTVPFPGDHGTVVMLCKTDRISNRHTTTFASTLRKRAGQVFRKFLKSGLQIKVNEKPAEAIDPMMINHPDTKIVLETEIDVADGCSASLRVVDLPDLGGAGNKAHGIIPQNSGFYILRNNREIMEAQTFEFYKKHPDFSHFRAELSFHGSTDAAFHVDVKKSMILPSQAFLDKLRSATQTLISESSRQGRARANAGRGTIDHSAAEANISKRAPLIPKPKLQVEKRQRRGKKGTSVPRGTRERTPHLTHLKTIAGLKVIFEEGDYGPENPFYLVRQDKARIIVQYNREHPFWRELVEHANETKVIAILDYLVFAMANAELIVPEPATVVKGNVNATLVGLLV